MAGLTINEQERKKAYDLCECIVIGFQNEYGVNTPEYEALQKVYERIHEEVKPILEKEEIERNENIGVTTLSRYLGIKEYYAKLMLEGSDCLIEDIARYENIKLPNVKACFVGDLHQQILIIGEGKEEVISIYWSGGE